MARKPKSEQVTETVKTAAIKKDESVDWKPSVPIEEREPEVVEDELVVGTLVSKEYTPGTMSSKAFASIRLETKDGEVTLEAKSKLAQYITLLNNGERAAFFVEDGWIVGVA